MVMMRSPSVTFPHPSLPPPGAVLCLILQVGGFMWLFSPCLFPDDLLHPSLSSCIMSCIASRLLPGALVGRYTPPPPPHSGESLWFVYTLGWRFLGFVLAGSVLMVCGVPPILLSTSSTSCLMPCTLGWRVPGFAPRSLGLYGQWDPRLPCT